MESQRVKSLTEGYLRGWLTFEYPTSTSYVREALILEHIEERHVIDLMHNRLFIETVLRSNLSKAKEVLSPVFDLATDIVRLKLPSAAPKAKIKDNSQDPEALKKEMAEWKELFRKAAEAKTT